MRLPPRVVRPVFLSLVILSCAPERVVSPNLVVSEAKRDVGVNSASKVVISKVYGGGGNAGATYRNDFIEVFNRSTEPVSVAGWTVQYASSGGNSWQKTTLTGTIEPGKFQLIQEAAGTGGTISLPNPDATGSIPLSATAGKVALVRNGTSLTCGSTAVPCTPALLADVVDLVGFGSGTTVYEGTTGPTPAPSNTRAVVRKNGGCLDTDNNATDFATTDNLSPRNSASATLDCSVLAAIASITVRVSWVTPGTSFTVTATAVDDHGQPLSPSLVWSTAPTSIATVDPATGVATGVSTGIATITATALNGVSGSAPLFVVNDGDLASVSLTVDDPAQAPVGFTKPAFPTSRLTTFAIVTPTLTWSSSDPSIAAVSSLGYISGLAPGTVTIRATGPNGVYGEAPFTVLPATAPTTAIYHNHLEFGIPTDNTPADELILTKPQYVESYNKFRGGPNWVSWEINASQFGSADRCNCFTADQSLPGDVYHVVDFDYRNGGYDRGHMVQSLSRSTTDQENASTFLLTNILPQGAENNQGPWSAFENYLNDQARALNGVTAKHEIYAIAGGIYADNPATLKDEHKVAIPDYTYKIAVIMPEGEGLADVHSSNDLQVIAIKMPNLTTPGVPQSSVGIRNNPWQQYQVTVDELEAETGYDFLSNLPAGIQLLVEANDQPPVAKWGGETSGVEGSPVKFDGTGSTDPDANDALTYEWNFGDGVTGTGAKPTHVFADNGVYTVVLTVKDHAGAEDSQSNTVTVSNVAPTAAFGNNGPVDEGSRFTLSFSGASDQSTTDAAAGFQYRFDCGSGFGDWGSSPTVNCATTDNGLFPVRGEIRDKDGGSNSYAGSVRVNNVAPTALYINNGPVLEGAAFTLGFSGQSDPSSDDAAAGFQYRFDCGDGFGSWSTSPNVNCQTSDDGTYHTHAEIADKDGASTAYAADVVVQNTPPTGTFATTAPVNEGGVFTLSISGSADASSADQAAGFSYRFDCGNGFGAWSSSPARVCTATDNPGYSTLAEIRDKDGGYNTYSLFSTVRNVNPSVVLSSSPPIYSGGTYEISGGFADLGQADAPWSYSIDWGNGTTSGSTTMQGAITGSRSYANAGNYTVTLRVTDKDGGVGSASTTLHVNRLPGSMSVNPNQINIRSSGNGQVIATVFGNARFDGAAIDISSVRIGQVSPDEKGNGDAKSSIADLNRDGIADLVVHFNRDELVSSGALGASTSELVLYANLTDGRQIEARGSVSTR